MDTGSIAAPGDSTTTFYVEALDLLERARIPFLVGGSFALARYTKIDRETKDLDILLRPGDVLRGLRLFARAGFDAELTFPHWLGKVFRDGRCLDLVFALGNGLRGVDDDWFTYAVIEDVLGRGLPVCPVEELLWSKAFVQERERFDGADILHLLHARAATMDWDRMIARFGEHWPVLLSHLVTFRFAYPARRDDVPLHVMDALLERLRAQRAEPGNRQCFGTLLSRQQYLHDVTRLGYEDARLRPFGNMTRTDLEVWTKAIGKEG